jgi:hypothetical protein
LLQPTDIALNWPAVWLSANGKLADLVFQQAMNCMLAD